MIHTTITQNCVVFLTLSTTTVGQIFDAHKWPTVLVRKVKVKPRIFEANL